MSASLLGNTSGIKIEVKAEPLEIDPDRAVPFGLLVNELATNAIKHAFPDGTGRVVLSVEQIGDQIELSVADDGVGMKDKDSAKLPEKRGADYVAIFVRQLGGTIVPVRIGRHWNDRENTTSLASGATRGCRPRRCVTPMTSRASMFYRAPDWGLGVGSSNLPAPTNNINMLAES